MLQKLLPLLLPFILISPTILGQNPTRIPTLPLQNPNETTISIDPKNPLKWEVGANVDLRFTTKDAGESWKLGKFVSTSGIYGDPVLHYTFNGDLFAAHLSKNPQKKHPQWFDKIVVDRFFLNEKMDTVQQSFAVGYNNGKIQDKPWIHSDKYSEFQGNVYVTWTEFDAYKSADPDCKSRIRFSKWTPRTQEFSDAITISSEEGDCLDGPNTMEGATSTTDLDGNIYVTWAGKEKIWFTKSVDAGATWSQPIIIASQIGGWTFDVPNIYRVNSLPFIIFNPTHQTLVLCWGDQKNKNADIWIKMSRDLGETWSERKKINSSTNRKCFFPNITTDEVSGHFFVAYYDQRNSESGNFVDVYLSMLNPKGEVMMEKRVTPHSYGMPGSQFFFGDYLDLDFKNNLGLLAYTIYDQHQSFVEVFSFNAKGFSKSETKDTVIFNFQQEQGFDALWSKADYPFKAILQVLTINSKGKIKKKKWKISNKKLHQKEVFHKVNKNGFIFEIKIKKLKRLK